MEIISSDDVGLREIFKREYFLHYGRETRHNALRSEG